MFYVVECVWSNLSLSENDCVGCPSSRRLTEDVPVILEIVLAKRIYFEYHLGDVDTETDAVEQSQIPDCTKHPATRSQP